MLIRNLRKELDRDRVRAAATVIWENSDRPDQDLRFETNKRYEKDIDCDPHAFLIAAVMPAFRGEERRIKIDAKVDPEIRNGLLTAMRWIRHWWYRDHKALLDIEDQGDALPPVGNDAQRSAMFFSGGVDSLAALRANRINFPSAHPLSVKDGLLVYGLEVEDPGIFEIVLRSITALADAAELELIPVYTNVRDLNPDWMFWERMFHDAVFASIAHAFSARFNTISFAATYDVPNIQPAGSHPYLDLCYSRSTLRIIHDGIVLSRLDKLRLISDWDLALQNIRTCNQTELYRSGQLNCGRCRKCITTMLALMALGKLGETSAFPDSGITPAFLRSNFEIYKTTACWWEEVVQPLRERGHEDLARVIEKKLDEYYRIREKIDLRRAIFSKAKRLDLKYFQGRMNEIRNSINEKRRRAAAT